MILMWKKIDVLIGDIDESRTAQPLGIFDDTVISFLNEIARRILDDKSIRTYKDLSALAFFIRKSSLEKIKQKYDASGRLGLGLAFHITPSNIPVQSFYSLIVSLLAGNSNIIRVARKDFKQNKILIELMKEVLHVFPSLKSYICLLKYGHESEITDYFSKQCDVRIIWGGNETIHCIRNSKLPVRTYELTFADRFSLCMIGAKNYLCAEEKSKNKTAQDFYNDTFFSDQNACNSPRMVVWIGDKENCTKASKVFWKKQSEIVEKEYHLNEISVIDKFTKQCLAAMEKDAKYNASNSFKNYISIVDLGAVGEDLSEYKGNSGLFYQIYMENEEEIFQYVQKDWQTLVYYGIDPANLLNLAIQRGVKGIDRIVPIGKAAEPSLQWDGIDFIERLSRKVAVL